MLPTSKDLKIGEWIDVSKTYHKKSNVKHFELRLSEINKCVGKAYISEYGCSVRALFSTESDGIIKPLKTLKKADIPKVWAELMNELLTKMFYSTNTELSFDDQRVEDEVRETFGS